MRREQKTAEAAVARASALAVAAASRSPDARSQLIADDVEESAVPAHFQKLLSEEREEEVFAAVRDYSRARRVQL